MAAYKQIVRSDPSFNLRSLGENPDTVLLKNFGQALLEVRDEELKAREEQLRRSSGTGALLRSAVLPGWGQRYQGYSRRGYAMLGLTGAAAAYAVVAERTYRKARDAYRKAPLGADFDKFYEEATRKGDLADLSWGIVAGVWLFNVVDSVFQGPDVSRPRSAAFKVQAPARGDGLLAIYVRRF